MEQGRPAIADIGRRRPPDADCDSVARFIYEQRCFRFLRRVEHAASNCLGVKYVQSATSCV